MSCLHIKINKISTNINSITSINSPLRFKTVINTPYNFKVINVPMGLNINCDIINTEDF